MRLCSKCEQQQFGLLTRCFGDLSDMRMLNMAILLGTTALYLLRQVDGDIQCATLGASIFQFPEWADEQLSYILSTSAEYVIDASDRVPEFGVLVSNLQEHVLGAREVAAMVGGFVGGTLAEQLVYINPGIFRVDGVKIVNIP